MDNHVQRIELGWDETKEKAAGRLQFLQKTKEAWVGYADGLEQIANQFEKAEDEIKKVKKRFNLQSAIEDLEKRQSIFNESKTTIESLYKSIQDNYDIMTMTLPDDKKDFVKKEVKAVTEKLEVVARFQEKVAKIEDFVNQLNAFHLSIKTIDEWMVATDLNLKEIMEQSDKMTPEDRVSYTMELQEDIASKVKTLEADIAKEQELLPQGDKVPQDAQDHKNELKRVYDYVIDLQKRVIKECEQYSEDVKYWAEYKTGIKEFRPWLESAEKKSTEGLSKPTTLEEANAMFANVKDFSGACEKNIKILGDASGASLKMTTHKDADVEVAGLKERYVKVKAVADEWVAKVETLVKEWQLLDSTVNELNSWVGTERKEGEEQQFSLEKMESTLGELKNIFKEKEKLVENL